MSGERNIPIDDRLLISRAAHVLDRIGLAMTGAMIGTFVAAQLAKTNVASFQTSGFIGLTVLSGIIGFYLRINTPLLPNILNSLRPKVNAIEWLSAVGTAAATLRDARTPRAVSTSRRRAAHDNSTFNNFDNACNGYCSSRKAERSRSKKTWSRNGIPPTMAPSG